MPLAPTRDADARNLALDGIRGMASMVVVFWHLAVNFFPCAAWGVEKPTSLSWELTLYQSPLWVALSGSFAVCLFFVLSGYVLTIGFFRSRKAKPLIHRIVGRPIRLGVLAAASTIAIWFGSLAAPHAVTDLLIPVLTATGALEAAVPHLNLNADLSLRALLENIFWLPWLQPSDPKELYNGVLWTMHVELFGSFLVMTSGSRPISRQICLDDRIRLYGDCGYHDAGATCFWNLFRNISVRLCNCSSRSADLERTGLETACSNHHGNSRVASRRSQ